MKKKMTLRLIPALIAAAFCGGALASGFQLSEQSASGIGVANAGAAAAAEDASTVFVNPAGMTYLPERHNFSMATTVLDRSTHFTNEGTGGYLNAVVGKPIGDSGGDGGGVHAIPMFYYAYAPTPDWRFGMAVTPTFADETSYGEAFTGRYSGQKTSIKVINLNPSVAYKLNDALSVAVGINYARAEVDFKQATVLGPNTTPDGTGRLTGDGGAWGYNLGVMYQLQPQTRVGFSYRSKIRFHLKGEKTQTANPTRDITADLTTPDTASLALHHQVNSKWAVLADYTWSGWSSLQKLEPVYADGTRAVAPLRYNFKDTYRVGLGATYQLNEQWMLRFGTAYDKNPVPSDTFRSMTVPDADRVWLALGAKWRMTPKASLDFGYVHVFVKDARTARNVYSNPSETTVVQTIRGQFKTSADMLSVQLNYAF